MTEETSVETTPDALAAPDGIKVVSSQPESSEVAQIEPSGRPPTGEQEAFSEGDAPPPDTAEPKPRGVQKRIDELTANWRSAERDRDYWRDLAMRTPQQAPAPQPQTAPVEQVSAQPDPASFRDGELDPDYLAALAEHRADQRFRQLQADQEAQQRAEQQQAAASERYDTYSRKLASAEPDVRSKIEQLGREPHSVAPVTEAMVNVAIASDHGMQVLAYLHDNRADLQRIGSLPEHLQPYEMAKIEARMLSEAARVTKAPDPLPGVGGRGSVAPQKDPSKMSQAEYEVYRAPAALKLAQSGW